MKRVKKLFAISVALMIMLISTNADAARRTWEASFGDCYNATGDCLDTVVIQ